VSNRLARLAETVQRLHREAPFAAPVGHITEASSSGYQVQGLSKYLKLGSLVAIEGDDHPVLAEVIRMDREAALIKSFEAGRQVRLSARVTPHGDLTIRPHASWKGRVIDALARPIDGGAPLVSGAQALPVDGSPPSALTRRPVKTPIRTGIKVVDAFTPLCRGQRIGIFAGSGVGKSTLLGMLGQAGDFDTVIVVLVGERGREVREFAETTLHACGQRMVSIVATGDETAMMRRLAPRTGLRIAEYFRDLGDNVLLIMDSVTRYAHACRDVALAAGEAPVARGYPPSVFTDLPQLLERAGPGAEGSGDITGIFSVLVDGDDHNDPVADAIRGTLDGHIVLSREIAEQGRYPAVNLLSSISRLAQHVWSEDNRKVVRKLLALAARFEDSRDLVAMGGHQAGADGDLDRALTIVPRLYQALQQTPQSERCADPFAEIGALIAKPHQAATVSRSGA
jgi:flagellum-specific ATP synthase